MWADLLLLQGQLTIDSLYLHIESHTPTISPACHLMKLYTVLCGCFSIELLLVLLSYGYWLIYNYTTCKCAFCKTVAGLKCLIVLGLIHLIFFSFDSPPHWTVFVSLGLTHSIEFPGIPFDKNIYSPGWIETGTVRVQM